MKDHKLTYIRGLSVTGLLLLTGLVLNGCSLALTKNLVKLPPVSECQGWTVSRIMDKEHFGPATPRKSVQCALSVLRDSMKTMDRAKIASRLCWLLADTAPDTEAHYRFAAEGVRWAQISLNLGNWLDGEVHYYLAVNLGMAVEHSTMKAIKNLGRIMKHLKRAMELDPDTDMGGPQRVLAMIYLRAPSWPNGVGDVDKAVEMLASVCKKYPKHPLNHIFYAQALWESDGDDDVKEISAQLSKAERLTLSMDWGYYKQRWLHQIHELRCKYKISDCSKK